MGRGYIELGDLVQLWWDNGSRPPRYVWKALADHADSRSAFYFTNVRDFVRVALLEESRGAGAPNGQRQEFSTMPHGLFENFEGRVLPLARVGRRISDWLRAQPAERDLDAAADTRAFQARLFLRPSSAANGRDAAAAAQLPKEPPPVKVAVPWEDGETLPSGWPLPALGQFSGLDVFDAYEALLKLEEKVAPPAAILVNLDKLAAWCRETGFRNPLHPEGDTRFPGPLTLRDLRLADRPPEDVAECEPEPERPQPVSQREYNAFVWQLPDNIKRKAAEAACDAKFGVLGQRFKVAWRMRGSRNRTNGQRDRGPTGQTIPGVQIDDKLPAPEGVQRAEDR